jgi:hypothetical protein
MKILSLFKLALIWGKPEEIAEIKLLAKGTHHVHKNPERKPNANGYAGPKGDSHVSD